MTDLSLETPEDSAHQRKAGHDSSATAAPHGRDTSSALAESTTDEVWFADADGNLTLVNPAVWKEFGAQSGEPVEAIAARFEVYRGDGALRPPAEAPALRALRGEIIKDEEEIVRTPASGELRHRLVSGAPVRDGDGAIIGSVCVVHDVTEHEQAEEALHNSEGRLRLATAATGIGAFDWDTRAGVNRWSEELEAMHGLAPGEFSRTQRAWEQLVHSEDRATAVALVKDALKTGRPVEGEWRVVWPDGSVHWISGRFQAFKDEEGMPLRLSGVNIDITSQKASEEERRRSREDLDRAQAVGQIGSWRLDVRGDVLTWSDETYRIFGLPIGTPLTYEAFLSAVHPDDRAFVDAQWQASLRGEPYDIEHRLLVGGRVKWVREKAFLEYDEAGDLLGGFGIAQDVSDRKRTEEALRESEERYRAIVELADEDLTVSADGTYAWGSVADDARTRRRQLRAWLIALAARVRRHRLRVLLVAVALELAVLIPMGFVPTSRHVLGMPGSLLMLTVVITAVLTGWQAGIAAAIAGGVIFWGTVADFGAQSAPITVVISTGIWVAAALISGLLADALRDQTRRRRSAAVALARAETLREREAERATHEERTRIARDLHDSVTQSLFAATLKAEALPECGDPAQLESVAEEVRRLNRGALAEMRTLLLELRGDPVEAVPIPQLLRNVVEAAESRASVKVTLTLNEESALPTNVHEAVYRITQEALNNVVRHAKASNAWVQLDVEPWHASLLIGDDGCGFDPDASVDPSHSGLKSMRERAGGSGGVLAVRSVPGDGTALTAEWHFEVSARMAG